MKWEGTATSICIAVVMGFTAKYFEMFDDHTLTLVILDDHDDHSLLSSPFYDHEYILDILCRVNCDAIERQPS